MDRIILNIAIVGGTGKEGKGLAFRWGKAGHRVVIGSRNLEKAQFAVNEIKPLLPNNSQLTGDINESAIKLADIVVITIPYQAHREILYALKKDLQGKIIIDVTVPLVPPQVTKVQMPADGSAAQETQKILGQECRVASAFQNISYDLLLADAPILCDVLVCCSDQQTKQMVLELVKDAGLSGWDAGPLENSAVVEGLTSILININKKYHSRTAGIRITGIDSSSS
jgi:8-hydroxy-5-deazaflavin:NADPH oxidoreductase